MRRLNFFLLMFSLAACSSKDDDADDGELDDQGVVDADGGDQGDVDIDGGTEDTGEPDDGPEPCLALIEDMDPDPDDAVADWFYMHDLEIEFEYLPEPSYTITLVDSSGAEVPFEVEWAESDPDAIISANLVGNETYTLTATCGNEVSTTFSTSNFGGPLEDDPSALADKVFVLNLPGARFEHPPMIGSFLGDYLTSALLASVADVNDEDLTLLVAQGNLDDDYVATQDMDVCPYDFPPADFSDAPFFAADTDLLEIKFRTGASSGVDISLYEMHLEGTISPDGTAMGGAWISGLLETSNLGPLIDISGTGTGLGEEESAVCDMLGTLGLPGLCVPCAGSDYCLYVEAHFDEAPAAGIEIDPDPTGECLAE